MLKAKKKKKKKKKMVQHTKVPCFGVVNSSDVLFPNGRVVAQQIFVFIRSNAAGKAIVVANVWNDHAVILKCLLQQLCNKFVLPIDICMALTMKKVVWMCVCGVMSCVCVDLK